MCIQESYLDAAVSDIDLSLLNEQSEQQHQNAAFYLLYSEGIFEHQNMGIFRHKIPILLLKEPIENVCSLKFLNWYYVLLY